MARVGLPLGTIYRGSTRHRILAELERYPDTWVRWYQIPGLEDIAKATIQTTFHRLMREHRVDSRRVFDSAETASGSSRRPHGYWYIEIRHRDEEEGA